MNLILIFLTGTLMGALNLGFFILGYYFRGRREDGITINDRNKDYLKDLMEWQQYGGGHEN